MEGWKSKAFKISGVIVLVLIGLWSGNFIKFNYETGPNANLQLVKQNRLGGVYLLSAPIDGFQADLIILSGSNSPEFPSGTAHLTEHLVAMKWLGFDSPHVNSAGFAATTQHETIRYKVTGKTEFEIKYLFKLKELLWNPYEEQKEFWNEQEYQREVAIVEQEHRRNRDQYGEEVSLISNAITPKLYGKYATEPVTAFWSFDNKTPVSYQDTVNFHKETHRAENAILILTGPFDEEKVRSLISQTGFPPMKAGLARDRAEQGLINSNLIDFEQLFDGPGEFRIEIKDPNAVGKAVVYVRLHKFDLEVEDRTEMAKSVAIMTIMAPIIEKALSLLEDTNESYFENALSQKINLNQVTENILKFEVRIELLDEADLNDSSETTVQNFRHLFSKDLFGLFANGREELEHEFEKIKQGLLADPNEDRFKISNNMNMILNHALGSLPPIDPQLLRKQIRNVTLDDVLERMLVAEENIRSVVALVEPENF